jgi:hypothetical protein
MLEKKIETGLITVMHDGKIQVREDTVVYENGVELSRTYMRYLMNPGDNIEDKPPLVRSIAKLVWTPEVVEKWLVIARTPPNSFEGLKHNG